MPKQKQTRKESVSSEPEDEDYDSEEMSDDEEMESSSDALGDQNMREVNHMNVLNYQTDSDDDDSEGLSDELGQNLAKQKEELLMTKEAWGKQKKNYYKADSDSDEGSEDEEELAKEALRLQAIRQKKLAKQFAARKDSEDDSEGQLASKQDVKLQSSDEESNDDDGKARLGDKLFDSEEEGHEETKKAAEL